MSGVSESGLDFEVCMSSLTHSCNLLGRLVFNRRHPSSTFLKLIKASVIRDVCGKLI